METPTLISKNLDDVISELVESLENVQDIVVLISALVSDSHSFAAELVYPCFNSFTLIVLNYSELSGKVHWSFLFAQKMCYC